MTTTVSSKLVYPLNDSFLPRVNHSFINQVKIETLSSLMLRDVVLLLFGQIPFLS